MLPIIDLSESSKKLLTIRPGQNLFDAILKMHNHQVHHLIVAEEHSFYGILPCRHILQYLQEKKITNDDLTLIEVSSLPLVSHAQIKEEHHLEEAISEMAQLNLSCIPVVDRYGRVTGILTETDIIAYLAHSYSDAAHKHQSAADREKVRERYPANSQDPTHPATSERQGSDIDLDIADRSKVYLANPVIQSVMKTISELGL